MSNAVTTTGILVKRRAAVATIVSNSIANPTVVTTVAAHGFTTGDTVTISGNATSSPTINSALVATRIDATHFSVPVNVTVAGTGGIATAAATFVTVAEITKAKSAALTRNKLDTSTHNDGTESNTLGILRQADGTLTINYIGSDATHATLLQDMLSNVKSDWKYVYPSGITYDGPARLQTFTVAEATVDGIQQADIVLTWAGPVVAS